MALLKLNDGSFENVSETPEEIDGFISNIKNNDGTFILLHRKDHKRFSRFQIKRIIYYEDD